MKEKKPVNDEALVLETKGQPNHTTVLGAAGGSIMINPAVDEDYWLLRVRVSEEQAVVGFPKFITIGIGFAVEKVTYDCNFPHTCTTEEIYAHIRRNQGDDAIPAERVLAAIRLVQEAAGPHADRLGREILGLG